MSTRESSDGLQLLGAVRDALATPQGARLAREIRALIAEADCADDDRESYAARFVARAYARAEGRLPARKQRRRGER